MTLIDKDELRREFISRRPESPWPLNVIDNAPEVSCLNCRRWAGFGDDGGVHACLVRGSFSTAAAGLRTEADFGCVHFELGRGEE